MNVHASAATEFKLSHRDMAIDVNESNADTPTA